MHIQIPGHRGFTLIELVVVMVISGIIAMMLMNIISLPMEGYGDMKRRAELVDMAEMTLHRIARDIRRALPNSIRISADAQSIEMLHTVAGGHYNKSTFDTTQAINRIDQLTPLSNSSEISVDPSVSLNSDCAQNGRPDCLVIYNLGNNQTDTNAYRGNNISAIKAVSNAAPNFPIDFVSHRFKFSSPQQRFTIINKAQTYTCNPASSTLFINEGYDFIDSDNIPPVFSGGYLIADNISQCSFKYNPGTLTRPALVTMEITLTEDNENIKLLHQVFLGNQP